MKYIPTRKTVPSRWYHSSTLTSNYGMTAAMIYATQGIIDIPKVWWHQPDLQNDFKRTVAMIFVNYEDQCNCNIPDEWCHEA